MNNLRSGKNGFLGNSAFALVAKVFSLLSGYVFLLFVSRNYGAESVGLYALCTSVISIVAVVARLGFDTHLVKVASSYRLNGQGPFASYCYRLALKVSALLALFFSLGLFVFRDSLAVNLFGKPGLSAGFCYAAAAVLPIVAFQVNAGFLRGLGFVKVFAFLQNSALSLFSLFLVLLLALCFGFDDIYTPVLAYTLSGYVTFFVSVYLVKKVSSKPSRAPGVTTFDFINDAFPLMLAASMGLVLFWADTIILGILKTETDVGVYNVAVRVSMLAVLALKAVNTATGHRFAELCSRGEHEELSASIHDSTRVIFWCSTPVLFLFVALPEFWLGFFGPEFKVASTALIFLSVGMFVNAISGSVGILLQMSGHHVAYRNITFVALALNIGLNFLLIPSFGINGAAFASMVAIAIRNIASVFVVYHHMRILTVYLPFIHRKR